MINIVKEYDKLVIRNVSDFVYNIKTMREKSRAVHALLIMLGLKSTFICFFERRT